MQLLNPLALLYLPLIAAVLLLARRHVVRQRRTVGALFLWMAVDAQDPLAASRLAVRRRWLLFVQALLLLSLALALARPTIALSRSRVAFLVDVSASMGAREQSGTRLELAKLAAERAARALPTGTRVSLWTADAMPAPVAEVNPSDVPEVLSRLTLSDGSEDIATAIATVRAAAGTATPIFVFTDRSAGDLADAHVGWTTVGTTAPNVAITSLSGRRLTDPAVTEVVVGIRNFGPADVDAPFEIRQNNSLVATERLSILTHTTMTAVLRLPPLDGVISAHLLEQDALDADNLHFAVLPAASPRHALLIGSGNFFLERALASVANLTVETITPGDHGARDRYDVVVCDGCDTAPGNEPALLLPPATSTAASLEPFRIVSAGHRVARFLDVSGASVSPLAGPAIPNDAVVVGRAGDIPVVVAAEPSGRRVVELRMDLRESPLLLSTAFPILMSNAIAWLTQEGENASAIVAGEPLTWAVSAAASVAVQGPNGTSVAASLNGDRLSIAATRRAGVYDVRLDDRLERFVANPATDTESDLTVTPTSTTVAATTSVQDTRVPVHLTAALLVAALLLLGAEFALSRPPSWGARAFRAAVAMVVAAAAAAPRIPFGDAREDVLFLLDRSASMTAGAEAQSLSAINTLAKSMRAGDRAGLIVFGADAVVERPLDSNVRISTITSRTPAAATNIEAALRLANEMLNSSTVRRVVLLSDGHETVGDSRREAARLAANGLAVDVVPLSIDADARLVVNGLSAPALVRTAEPFIVAADIRGQAGARAEIELRRNGESLSAQPVAVGPDGTAIVEFTEVHHAPGIQTYTAALRAGDLPDGLPDAGAVVTVSGQPSMLYVSDGPATLARLFESAQWALQRASLASLPNTSAALARYDAVVIEEADADRLSTAQVNALTDYVQDAGGGLLLLGGTSTIGTFQTSPLNHLLPVDLRPHSGARGPEMALVLAFDKSGSMSDVVGGVTKIELARQSVLGALQAIPPTDLFGAIAFDSRPVAIAPLGAGHDIPTVTRGLRALEAGGSTAIAPAIDLAETWLRASGVSRRRVLLVSDGRTAPGDVDRLRAAVRTRQFELSVVAIGNDADRGLLTGLAAESGGRAYFPADISELPEIVARDAAAASSGNTVSEPFAGRVRRHAATRGIDPSQPPTLAGYAVSAAKSGAEVILASHLDDPVLAGWRIGLGRVAVFTSDLRSTSARAFTGWPAFGRLWTQTVRWLGRHASPDGATLALESRSEGVHIRVTFEPASGDRRIVDATASLRRPSERRDRFADPGLRTDFGPEIVVPLKATAPGRFEGTARLGDEGTYVASIALRRADASDEQIVQGTYWSAVAERPSRLNRPALEAIAGITGGRVLTGPDSPFLGPRPGEPTNVGPLMTHLALVALLIEIARRRGLFAWSGRRSRRDRGIAQRAAA